MEMKDIIAKVGKGQKAWKDLTWDEAKQAMRLLVEGEATPAQVGGFLLAMRIKMESVAELAAFTAAAREYVPALDIPQQLHLVDLPTYAGKQDTFHASVGAAIVAAVGGATVLMHGYDGIPERPGTAAVLAKLGIPTELAPKRVANEAAAKGFAYLDIALYHPPIARFLDLRAELGVRNFFHPVAKLLNPARARSQVIGLTHPPYFEKTAEALRMLGCRRALVLRGVEGDPELSIAAVTKVLEVSEERVLPLSLQPKDVSLPLGTFQDMAGFPRAQADQEAGLIRRILQNQVRRGPRDWIVMNAAMLLYAAGKTASISAGVPVAQQALDTGAAARKLDDLIASGEPAAAVPAADSRSHQVSGGSPT